MVQGGVGIVHGGVGDGSVQGGLSLPPGESFPPGVPGEPPFEVDPEGKEETKPPAPTPDKK